MTDLTASEDVLELTDREIALAAGADPDESPGEAIGDPVDSAEEGKGSGTDAPLENIPSPEDDAGAGIEAEVDGSEPAQEASKSGGGTDAAWYSDEDLELAASYGLDEAGLGQYGSREEFSRVATLLDRNLALPLPSREVAEPAAPSPNSPASDVPPSPEPPPSAPAAAPSLDPKVYAEKGFDAETVAIVEHHSRLVQHTDGLEKRLVELETASRRAEEANLQQQQKAFNDAFHDVVDGMDETLYGRSVVSGAAVTLTGATDENRRKLYDQMAALQEGMTVRAARVNQLAQIPPLPVMLRRAQQLLFGEELQQREKQAHQEKVAQQSRRRRSVASGTRPRVAPEAPVVKEPVDEAERVANHPDVVKAFRDFQEENGAAA